MKGALCQICFAVTFLAFLTGIGGQFDEVTVRITCFWCEYQDVGGIYDRGDGKCKDPFPATGTPADLALGQKSCYGWCLKGKKKTGDTILTIRDCVTRCIPEYMNNAYDEFNCCNDTSLCNSAPSGVRLTSLNQRLLFASLPTFVLAYVITGNRYSV